MEIDSSLIEALKHRRAVDIVRLVPTGMSNREIGKKLFICEKTVKWHLSSVYKKLGVNRIQLCEIVRRYL